MPVLNQSNSLYTERLHAILRSQNGPQEAIFLGGGPDKRPPHCLQPDVPGPAYQRPPCKHRGRRYRRHHLIHGQGQSLSPNRSVPARSNARAADIYMTDHGRPLVCVFVCWSVVCVCLLVCGSVLRQRRRDSRQSARAQSRLTGWLAVQDSRRLARTRTPRSTRR